MTRRLLALLLAVAMATGIGLAGSTDDDWNVGGNLAVTGTSSLTGGVTLGGVVRAADGTAALPAFSFSGDTNSGMYSVGADNIGFSAGGTLRLDLDGTDLVSTVPFRGAAGSAAAPTFSFSGDSNSGMYSGGADSLLLGTGGNGHFQLNSAGQWLSQVGTSASAPAFSWTTDVDTGIFRDAANVIQFSTGGTERMIIDSSGNVGIGADPSGKFAVEGSTPDIRLTHTGGAQLRLSATGTETFVDNNSAHPLTVRANGVGGIKIDNATGAAWIVVPGVASSPGLSFSTDSNCGIFRDAADVIQFATAGTERMIIDSSGQVGIGGDPSGSLHVTGSTPDIRLTHTGGATLRLVATGTDSFCDTNSAHPLTVRANGTGGMVFSNSTGLVQYVIPGVASAPGISFTTDTNCGIARDAADVLKIVTAGSARATFFSTGGVSIGAPSGGASGDMGAGTLNVDTDVYKDGTAYTNPDYVFEQAYTGKIEQYAARPGASSYKPRTIEEMETYVKKYHRFPGIKDTAMGVFERSDFVLERLEEQFLYIAQVNRQQKEILRRLAALERR